jgi:hypothetical protein
LLDYDFFDENGLDIMGKIGRGTLGVMGAATGAIVGGGLGLSSVLGGGIVGGYGMSKASNIAYGTHGESNSYGLVVRVKDSKIENPTLIFDFYSIAVQRFKLKKIPNYILGTNAKGFNIIELNSKIHGDNRSAAKYKNNMSAIIGMAGEFDYILNENMKNAIRENSMQPVSDADELAKFKKLLDDGVITQEEFNTKKKQLLGV